MWINVLTVPGTPDMHAFYRDLEQFMLTNYSGNYATFRPEWSKGWAFSASGGFKDTTKLSTTIPNMYRAGQPSNDNWDTAKATLNTLDPHRVFSNTFIDQLL